MLLERLPARLSPGLERGSMRMEAWNFLYMHVRSDVRLSWRKIKLLIILDPFLLCYEVKGEAWPVSGPAQDYELLRPMLGHTVMKALCGRVNTLGLIFGCGGHWWRTIYEASTRCVLSQARVASEV